MKVINVDIGGIYFDDGSEIESYHEPDCCEYNYADFMQVKDEILGKEFEEPIEFESVEGYGFRFGNKPSKMFFVPCYSEQNGYYSFDVSIRYKHKCVLNTECKWVDG